MVSKKASAVVDKTVSYLSKCPGVAALVLAGSQVEGVRFVADQYSDIELYVVALDEKYSEVEKAVQKTQDLFAKEAVVLAYKNQWAGWSVLFADLLRLELPVVKASEKQVFSRPKQPKIKVLYSRPGFHLQTKSVGDAGDKKPIDNAIKDFWYMAVYAAQHIGRGEIWLAREAVRISLQGKIKRLIQDLNHSDVEADKRIELVWSPSELAILKETSCAYDRQDLIRAFWANIKYAKGLSLKTGLGQEQFEEYEKKLLPSIKRILASKG